MTERHVPFEACFNFRDIGGYETTDGRRVRWGAVFRSGSLHRLTSADRELTARLGVRTVVDLRSTAELHRDGHFGGSDDVSFHHIALEEEASEYEDDARDDHEANPGEMYAAMATAGGAAVVNAVRVVAEGEHPVVIHCLAGKDRTGIVAALILSSLGVPDATVAADYQLSEHSVAPSIAWAQDNDPAWAALMASLPPWVLRAPPSAMPVFLESLRSKYGTIDDYLVHQGLERSLIEQLRTRLLEPERPELPGRD